MTQKQLIKTVNTLLTIAVFCNLYAVFDIVRKPHEPEKAPVIPDRIIHVGNNDYFPKDAPEGLVKWSELRNEWFGFDITYKYKVYEYLGEFFITSYCPEECGYNGSNYPTGWRTASGTICHYSDKWDEPTTCAIDRNYFGFGEEILVGDPYDPNNRKIYVTEDTGPGVRGAWVDCFVESMDEVRAWPTGWQSVYRVTYAERTITSSERMKNYERTHNSLYSGGFWSGVPYRLNN